MEKLPTSSESGQENLSHLLKTEFPGGKEVTVERSDGELDEGWMVHHMSVDGRKYMLLDKPDGEGGLLTKEFEYNQQSLEDLRKWN